MWWPFKKNDSPTFTPENTISAGTIVRGDLSSPRGFRIDGTVEGSVETDGPVVIGENGKVLGTVTGADVVVLGGVCGDIRASGHMEIGANGKIVGDISVQSFTMHKGGVFRGASRMPGADELASASDPFGILPYEAEAPHRHTLPPADLSKRDSSPPSVPDSHERLLDDDGTERAGAVNE